MKRSLRSFPHAIAVAALAALGCGGSGSETKSTGPLAPHAAPLSVSSPAFVDNGLIPREHTCEGDDESTPLQWGAAPAGTKSFAVIVDDPDAPDPAKPEMVFVHWLVYDLPPDVHSLATDAADALPDGARHGTNDGKTADWSGPCPPTGKHRYFHRVFALDTTLGDLDEPDRAALERAMKGHVLAKGEIVGTYQKSGD